MTPNTYTLEDADLIKKFAEIDGLLGNVEVKGESVAHLYNARALLKAMFSQIKEKPKEEE